VVVIAGVVLEQGALTALAVYLGYRAGRKRA